MRHLETNGPLGDKCLALQKKPKGKHAQPFPLNKNAGLV